MSNPQQAQAIPTSLIEETAAGIRTSEPEHIAGGIKTSAAIGVHKLIFDFCGGRLWRALSACSGSPPQLIPLMTG